MPRLSEVTAGAEQPRRLKLSQLTQPAEPERRQAMERSRRVDPTEGMSPWELNMAGLGESLVDGWSALKQAGTSAAEYFVRSNPVLFGEEPGVSGRSMSDVVSGQDSSLAGRLRASLDRQQAEQAERNRLDEPLLATGAGRTGSIVGTVGQIIGPGGVLKAASRVPQLAAAAPAASTASRVFLPTSGSGAVAQGAGIGVLQQAPSVEDRQFNTALGTGAAAAGVLVPRAVGAVARPAIEAARSLSGNMTRGAVDRRAATILRAEAEDASRVMQPAPSRIPGVQRTLAEETLDPGIARLERNSRATGQGWDPLDRANNAARVSAIEGFAGDAASLEAAREARSTATNRLRRDALGISGVDTTRLISQIKRMETMQTGRPAVQQGLRQIRELLTRAVPDAERLKAARDPLTEFVVNGRKSKADYEAGQAALQAVRRGERPDGVFTSERGRAALKQAQRAFDRVSTGQDRVAVLDNIRKTIGDMLGGKLGGESAAALAGSRELMSLRAQLDRVLAKQAPEYGQYLDAYRQGSRPINRMEVGQSLLSQRSGSAILDPVTGKQVLTPASFSNQARNLDRVAQQATGFRKARATDILEPDDFNTIDAVQQDLERRAFAATGGSGGNSQTFERMALNDRLAGGFAGRISVVGPVLRYLGEIGETRLQARLTEILQNPEQARALLARMPVEERRALEEAFSRNGGRLGALLPALQE